MVRPSRTIPGAAAVVLTAVGVAGSGVLAGCGSAGSSGVSDALVLRPADMPAGYALTARVSPAQGCTASTFTRADVGRVTALGAVGCTLDGYRRRPTPSGPEDLVALRTYRFREVPAAVRAVAALRRQYLVADSGRELRGRHSVAVAGLGDAAPRGVRSALAVSRTDLATAFAFWWRRGTRVAAVTVVDQLGDFDAATALALARRIDGRAAS